MMISLLWGVVAARIFKGDEDLATLRCSLAQQRCVTARISHDHGLRDLVTLRCSLAQQRRAAARILQGKGDLATPRCCSWPNRGEAHYYSWAEGGNTHHCSLRCCSWAEESATSCYSISMNFTLDLLRGRRRKERRKIKSMRVAAVYIWKPHATTQQASLLISADKLTEPDYT